MATVYLAYDRKHRRQVALKVLHPELTPALGPDRFLREIQIAAGFVHRHIIPVFDSGEADGFLYYVMPYVAGESLRARLNREHRLPIDDAVEIACEVADALAYAHVEKKIIHRDIKPENILLEEGHAIVTDFGIARPFTTVTTGTENRITTAGLALGTPMYMSPEQADGQVRIDGRADVYSLGCVLYEMLVGEPPFEGPTALSIIAQHAQRSARPVRELRPEVSPELEAVVAKALNKLPDDRFAGAAQLAAALPRRRTSAELRNLEAPRRSHHVSRAGWALIGALALAAGLTATAFHRRSAPVMDQSLYMVLPFRHRAQSAQQLLNGDQCESLLHEALARWHGVQMVDPLWVADARQRRGGPTSVEGGLAIARERRAGRVVLGEVWQFKDTVYVRGMLYDAGRERLLREHSVRIAPDLSDAQSRFQALADSLLIGGGVAAPPPPSGGGQLSLPAWRAFQDAYAAMQQWDLDSAKAKLQQALAIDPGYGLAQLWMAQVMAWRGEDPESWKQFAGGALASNDSLAPRDRGIAEGMLALSEARYPQACEKFGALIARDSLDFAAWFGLGDCQGKDPLVVPNPASPSKWMFRGSYQAAVNAYRRALQIVPSVHLAFRGEGFSRLPELLYTESTQIRRGIALGPDTMHFGAFPSLSHDTLAFVPWPIQEVTGAVPHAMPTTLSAAVQHNRLLMRDIASGWVQAFPGRADAHETLARVLESLGEVTSPGSPDRSAMSEIRRGRELARGTEAAFRLSASEVRLLLKTEQLTAARALADSLLSASSSNPTPGDAEQLPGLAALTGRLHLAADLERRASANYRFMTPDWTELHLAPPLTEAAMELLAYSSFGTPVDSIAALERRVERLIPSYVEPDKRPVVRQVLLDPPAVLAFPERGRRPAHRPGVSDRYLLTLQWELATGDTIKLREEFEQLRRLRAGMRPGDVAFDAIYHEAHLLLALQDTAAATRLLDLSLDALPTLRTDVLEELPQVATLVRGMALRAELAAQSGDSTQARRWARGVLVLWAAADPELQPTLHRMRAIVQ